MQHREQSQRTGDLYEDMKSEITKSDRSLMWFGLVLGGIVLFFFAPAIMRLVGANVSAYRYMMGTIKS